MMDARILADLSFEYEADEFNHDSASTEEINFGISQSGSDFEEKRSDYSN